ncbi:MAG TPA: OadG family transporter subunit [Bacillota bacterium]|nr:OadG family transporter subunit [Bacillota bacterium]
MHLQTFYQALQVSLYGICGVFLVLILFFFLTKLILKIARKYSSEE